MRLTKRCIDLFHLLHAARWLTTRQVRTRFFPKATADAARKRLRKLVDGKYLVMYRENRMSEALFALGPEGKRMLEISGKEVTLERKPPAQVLHLVGINDLRLSAELTGEIAYFFACWELPGVGWRYSVIPDAVFSTGGRTFALEFDRGVESVRFFMKTKVEFYRKALEGFPLAAVLVIADRKARMESLARSIPNERGLFLFSTIDEVRKRGLLGPVFLRGTNEEPVSLFSGSLLRLSCRQESFLSSSGAESRISPAGRQGS